jgi:hypothetical protein
LSSAYMPNKRMQDLMVMPQRLPHAQARHLRL